MSPGKIVEEGGRKYVIKGEVDLTMLELPQNGESPSQNGFHTVRFGEFEADLRIGEIRKAGSRIKLQDQPFKVLQILLEIPAMWYRARSYSRASGLKTVMGTSITRSMLRLASCAPR